MRHRRLSLLLAVPGAWLIRVWCWLWPGGDPWALDDD